MSNFELCHARARSRVKRNLTAGLKVYDDRETTVQPSIRRNLQAAGHRVRAGAPFTFAGARTTIGQEELNCLIDHSQYGFFRLEADHSYT
jgi:hypothetical protein